MPNSFLTDSNDAVIASRLGRLQAALLALTLSTREEYQAEVYSLVNRVLNLGDTMQPLSMITSRPAIVGDLTANLMYLNQDATDIASEIQLLEGNVGALYNLAAASQNALRQTTRSAVYASSSRQYTEAFIDDSQLKPGYTASLDFNAGVASLPLSNEVPLVPTFALGPACIGSGTSLANLNNTVGTFFQWTGTLLQLILTFPGKSIINRLTLALDTFDGLEITALTSSPDGLIFDDILADLGVPGIQMDASSGKYSGDVILDFPPRYVQTLALTISCLSGQPSFGLQNIRAFTRTYAASGTLTSGPISPSSLSALFSSVENDFGPYCSITHQVSTDGVNFAVVQPGQVTVASPFWYQALLNRSDTAFTQQNSALNFGTSTPPYTVNSQSTTSVSTGIVEQTLVLGTVTGPVVFQDLPLPNTFQVEVGSTVLVRNVDYSLSGKTLTFTVPQTLVTITYQTSAMGAAALAGLKTYYTPLLYECRFRTN